ncbi:WSC domain-containing protein [Panaeolus papilionaceus]|nr:WSC domain-containing protein [Panaeolus papilionaceus]
MFSNMLQFVTVTLALVGTSALAHPTNTGTLLETRQTGASIKRTVGTWQYKGCYKDFGTRLLTYRFDVPGGNNAERCTSLCASNGYGLAGMEYGQECWCDNYMPFIDATVLMPDGDCNTVCPGDSTELCGAGNRLTLYQNSVARPPDPNQCIAWRNSWWNGNLRAVRRDGTGSPTQLWTLYTNPLIDPISYNIISGPCPDGRCAYDEHIWTINNNALTTSWDSPAIKPNIGDSQAFIRTYPNTRQPYAGYCQKPNKFSPQAPFIGYPLLSVDGYTDKWAFCTNTTASNRLDIVYWPIANHPHYNKDTCVPVNIEVVY